MKPLVYKKAKRVRHKPAVRQKLHIAKGDMVQVISGDEKGLTAYECACLRPLSGTLYGPHLSLLRLNLN